MNNGAPDDRSDDQSESPETETADESRLVEVRLFLLRKDGCLVGMEVTHVTPYHFGRHLSGTMSVWITNPRL